MTVRLFDRVAEITATTGTGALTLGGALIGFRSFSSVYTTGNTLYYAIEAIDGLGEQTGAWETGIGTFNGSGQLERTTVIASSNAGALVDLAAGNKRVFVAPLASGYFDLIHAVPTTIAGTSYTATLDDAYSYLRFTNAAAITFTVPPAASVNFAIGTAIAYRQAGAGVVTLVQGAGVTLNSRGGLLATAGQHAGAQIKKIATNEWDVWGDVA